MGITNLYTKEVRNKVEPRRTRKNCKTNESRKETKMMSYKQIVVAAVIAGMISFSVTVSTVVADVPSLMSYQGKLTDETGTDVPDGDYCMDFKIYDSPTNGIVLWSERQISVPVANGLFSVLLGSDQPIPDTVFNGQERWLGVALCDSTEMTPRHPMVSVAYAYKASEAQNSDSLNGLPSSSFLQLLNYYDSGWFSIGEGNTVTKTHGLGGDPSQYLVFLYGKSSDGKIHQKNYGGDCARTVNMYCYGCWWYGLDSSQIKIGREEDDGGAGSNGDWDQAKVLILKIQLPPVK